MYYGYRIVHLTMTTKFTPNSQTWAGPAGICLVNITVNRDKIFAVRITNTINFVLYICSNTILIFLNKILA